MPRSIVPTALVLTALMAAGASAQEGHLARLPAGVLDATPPGIRVEGAPGRMATRPLECRTAPAAEIRRRIVDIAVQEWGFFGFPIIDEITDSRLLPLGMATGRSGPRFEPAANSRRFWRLSADPEEAARVASSIAGYWAVTAEGPGIVRRQNDAWNGEDGIASRWVDPWSAAFISWVMCEAGLATPDRFRRSIAHRSYIDQAIRARDTGDPSTAFVAYDVGEAVVEPGDMLCASSRPPYRNLAERRSQLGVGARTHCDIVVKVDGEAERVFTIGGNVMRAVSMKIFAAVAGAEGVLRPVVPNERRPLFAHLKLRGKSIDPNALDQSPTLRTIACDDDLADSARLALVGSTVGVLPGIGSGEASASGDRDLSSISIFAEASSPDGECGTS